jgi:hypothetical protein
LTKKRKIILLIPLGAIGLIIGTSSVALDSIKFDLRKIGESVYEAHNRTGKWPTQIEDLDDTEYLRMPYRRDALQRGLFVVVWQQDLNAEPRANHDRILAYDNGSLFSRLGYVLACRGDLTIGRVDAETLKRLKMQTR